MSGTRRYNARQRKKKHLGEFQELGFLVGAAVVSSFSEADRDAFIDRFLGEAIEANGLAFGGGLNADFGGFVVSEKSYGRVDESHREMVLAWLQRQNNLKNIEVGPLRDAWYGWG